MLIEKFVGGQEGVMKARALVAVNAAAAGGGIDESARTAVFGGAELGHGRGKNGIDLSGDTGASVFDIGTRAIQHRCQIGGEGIEPRRHLEHTGPGEEGVARFAQSLVQLGLA